MRMVNGVRYPICRSRTVPRHTNHARGMQAQVLFLPINLTTTMPNKQLLNNLQGRGLGVLNADLGSHRTSQLAVEL